MNAVIATRPAPHYRHAAQQRAYARGAKACQQGQPRIAPYAAGNRVSRHFRSAWLAGYDSVIARADGVR